MGLITTPRIVREITAYNNRNHRLLVSFDFPWWLPLSPSYQIYKWYEYRNNKWIDCDKPKRPSHKFIINLMKTQKEWPKNYEN